MVREKTGKKNCKIVIQGGNAFKTIPAKTKQNSILERLQVFYRTTICLRWLCYLSSTNQWNTIISVSQLSLTWRIIKGFWKFGGRILESQWARHHCLTPSCRILLQRLLIGSLRNIPQLQQTPPFCLTLPSKCTSIPPFLQDFQNLAFLLPKQFNLIPNLCSLQRSYLLIPWRNSSHRLHSPSFCFIFQIHLCFRLANNSILRSRWPQVAQLPQTFLTPNMKRHCKFARVW